MWQKILLCFLIGSAYASHNPGWKDGTEYRYQIRARTLSSLHEISDYYTGIIVRAEMVIQPLAGSLYARLENPQYASIHSEFSGDYEAYIPDDQLSYKELPLSGKPFQIVMEDGVVRDLIVSKDVKNWEANILKGIVSQIQLDTKGRNVIRSHINALPKEDEYSATYKTMEDTVTGVSETLYTIEEFPQYIMQSKPWLVPLPNLKGQGRIMEIVKSKNYSHTHERPMYHHGWEGIGQDKLGSNKVGQIISRASVSRAIITGSLKRYTVQSSYTINKIIVSPTLSDNQKGSVISIVNVTLESYKASGAQPETVVEPISLGNLMYTYDRPSAGYGVRQGVPYQYHETSHEQRSSGEDTLRRSLVHSDSSENQIKYNEEHNIEGHYGHHYEGQYEHRYEGHHSSESREHASSEYFVNQQEDDLESAPDSPDVFMIFNDKNPKTGSAQDIVKKVMELVKEIASEQSYIEEMPEKNTLYKFIVLTKVIRAMNHRELQAVATSLYHTREEKNSGWDVYRDALAKSGTGPAFLAIRNLISNGQLDWHETLDVIMTMSHSVYTPTYQYMKQFFDLVTSPEFEHHYVVNETVAMAYSNLVNKVYVRRYASHNMYPVHTFGSFRNGEGMQFLRNDVIHYYGKKLRDAINRGDSVHIQLYIRVLGNIGDRKILEVFEPYLEGKVHISQFQRLMMIVALDNLVESNPTLARSVLYKVYSNRGDTQEIRVAAVYQLMRTSPPTDMLQRMAEETNEETNEDTNEQVNSVVKSAIESASELYGDEFKYLRASAQAARPYLTKRQYGYQYSKNYLRSYVLNEMKFTFKQNFNTIADESTFIPKGIKYSIRSNLAGFRERHILAHSMVSSVESLVHVVKRQFQEHREQEQRSKQAATGESFSFELAKLLDMDFEDREQLEGNLYFKAGDFNLFFPYDNHTIEQLPRWFKYLEESLKTGRGFSYNKYMNEEEKLVSYPTETGMSFVYTYDVPTMVSVQGDVQATANPAFSNGKYFNIPEEMQASWNIRGTVFKKIRGVMGFIAPFEHTFYKAGYSKDVQIFLPIRGSLQANIKANLYQVEIEATEPEKNIRLFHYRSHPYVASTNLFDPKENLKNMRTIQKPKSYHNEFTFGESGPAAPLRVEATTEHPWSLAYIVKVFKTRSLFSSMRTHDLNGDIENNYINIYYNGQTSTDRKMVFNFGYRTQYQPNLNTQEEHNSGPYGEIKHLQPSGKSHDRQQEFIDKVSAGIRKPYAGVVDASVEFAGQEYIATAAFARSDVDPKSRGLVYMQGFINQRPHQLAVSVKSRFPNTNGLDMEYAFKFDPTSTVQVQAAFGENWESSAKFNGRAEFRRTESRRNYVANTYQYRVCREQMQQGDYQLPACANVTQEANLLNKVKVQIKYENVYPLIWKIYQDIENYFRFKNYFYYANSTFEPTGLPENEVDVTADYGDELKAVNVTVKSSVGAIHFNNIPFNDWVKRIVVVHPTFNLQTRLMGRALGIETYRPICVIDKTRAVTFDNVTYPLHLDGNSWYVVFQQFYRHMDRQEYRTTPEQVRYQLEKYEVILRKSPESNSQKEVNIYVNNPDTSYQQVEVRLVPAPRGSGYSGSNPRAKVYINGEEQQYNDKNSVDVYGGVITVYVIPNGEVKVNVRDAFYVIYDGDRVKVTTTKHHKFRNSIRGLCGDYDGEISRDFQAPEGCILRNAVDFQRSYDFSSRGQNKQIYRSEAQMNKPKSCIYREFLYGNVISDIDAGRESYGRNRMAGCMEKRTVYVIEDEQICFSVEPVLMCKKSCQVGKPVMVDVPVTCVQKSNVANLWKKQIDEGNSPDFSKKQPTKTVKIPVHLTCLR